MEQYSKTFIYGFGAPGSGKTLDDFLNFIQRNSSLLASLLKTFFNDNTRASTTSGPGQIFGGPYGCPFERVSGTPCLRSFSIGGNEI
jgi:hypothetical protein